MPPDIKDRLVEMVENSLSDLNLTGLERPSVLPGSVGSDARLPWGRPACRYLKDIFWGRLPLGTKSE